jgi:TetR/AcrR family transcriptional repressor of nem operon
LESNKRLVNLLALEQKINMPIQKITKEEIVRKSIEIFRKRGYNKTSMSDLAKACGLHKGSFYHYFSSKEALMQEVLHTLHQYYKHKLFAIAYHEEYSPYERMQYFFKQQEPIFTQDLAGCLFGNITLETISVEVEFKEVLRAFFTDWIAAFQHIFTDSGRPESEAERLAKTTVMQIEGALMMMRVYEDVGILREACTEVLNLLSD